MFSDEAQPGDTFLRDLTLIWVAANLCGSPQFRGREDIMSADSIHIIVTVGIIALMFSWVPFVNGLCPPGFRSREKTGKKSYDARPETSPQHAASPPANPAQPSSLSSRRLANQSRDLLNAISARGHSDPVVPRIPRTSVENSLSRKEIIKTCAE